MTSFSAAAYTGMLCSHLKIISSTKALKRMLKRTYVQDCAGNAIRAQHQGFYSLLNSLSHCCFSHCFRT